MHRRRLGRLPLLIAFLLLLLPAIPAAARPAGPVAAASAEIRGFWVDAFHSGIKTPAQVNQLIADAHAANANALFVQVRRRGDAYFNESVEPRAYDTALSPAPFDPLAGLIQAAHSANPPLQVHAWVVVFPVWDTKYQTTDTARHVYYRHGCGNSCTWDDPNNWMTYRYNGGSPEPDYQLDPGHPGAARYTVDVLLHLVRHYDIDGLHLDYIRYYGSEYGYNQVNVNRFNAAYSRTGLPDPNDAQWKDWRREQVTGVVRRIYLETLAVKPDLIVSAATIAWGDGPGTWENTDAYKGVFQDWRGWLEEGIVDLAVPMNYDREHNTTQRLYFEHWIEWEKNHQYGRGVVVGPGAFINYIEGTLVQTQKALAASAYGNRALGVCFYSYANTNWHPSPALPHPNSEFYNALSHPSSYGTPPFPTPVNPPALPWKAAPSKGHLMGWAMGPAGPIARVNVALTGPTSRTLRSDGNGFFGAVDLPPGNYTLTLLSPAASPLYATVAAGRVALATIAPPAAQPAIRAVLVDAGHDGFKTPDQVDTLLADVRAAHLNAIAVQVRSRGEIYYDSPLEPRAQDGELAAGFDPLAYLLEKAHGGTPRIEVYAWVPVLSLWDRDTPPSLPDHLFNRHPEWRTQDYNGNQRSDGEYFLDPGHPAVLTYLEGLLVDLVSRYALDGLLLDSLYYPSAGSSVGNPLWGYNPTAVQRFRQRYGGSGKPAANDPTWMSWRREQLSNLLRRLYLEATSRRPALRVAVTAIAWGDSPDYGIGWENSSAFGRVLQDWRAWLEEGILDLAAPMNYDREYSTQQQYYDHWLAWEAVHVYGRGLLVLQAAYLNYAEHTLAQAGQALPLGKGVGFASYIPADLYADPEGNSRSVKPPRQPWYYSPWAEWWLWRALALPYGYTDPVNGSFVVTSPLFPGIVATSALPWKDTPSLGHARGRVLGPGLLPLDGFVVTVTLTPTQTLTRRLYSDGQGYFGTVDLPPGTYQAKAPGAFAPYATQYATVTAGRVARFRPDFAYQVYLPLQPRGD